MNHNSRTYQVFYPRKLIYRRLINDRRSSRHPLHIAGHLISPDISTDFYIVAVAVTCQTSEDKLDWYSGDHRSPCCLTKWLFSLRNSFTYNFNIDLELDFYVFVIKLVSLSTLKHSCIISGRWYRNSFMADPEIDNHNSNQNVGDNVYVTTMDRPGSVIVWPLISIDLNEHVRVSLFFGRFGNIRIIVYSFFRWIRVFSPLFYWV